MSRRSRTWAGCAGVGTVASVAIVAALSGHPGALPLPGQNGRTTHAPASWLRSGKPDLTGRAYSRLSHRDAVRIDRSAHSQTLGRPPTAPVPAATTRRVQRYLSDHVALLAPVHGTRSLVESSLPLRAPSGKRGLRPVRLALRHSRAGFEPTTPIVPIKISDTVPGQVTLPEIALSVAPATPGRASEALTANGRVFFPNVGRDTDFIVAPAATGAETFTVLRSQDSPEDVDLALKLPRRAILAADPRMGGYRVLRGGRPIAHVTPPIAWDANRKELPVRAQVDGNVLRMHVDHRGAQDAYPILVDPAIVEDFRDWRGTTSTDFRGWNYDADTSGKFTTFFGSSYLGNGLYMYNRTAQNYNDGDTRRWFFNVLGFGDAYIYRADFTNLYHEFNGTCLTEGIFSRAANAYEPGSPASQCAAITDYSSKIVCVRTDCTPGGTTGNSAMFGIKTQGAGPRSTFTGYLGGAAIYETDDVKPVMANGNFPSGWVSSAAGMTARGTDTGMGMERLVVDSPAKADWNQAQTRDFACAGDRNHRCPKIAENTFDSGNLPEGTVPVRATGTDVLGDTSTQSWDLQLDATPPDVTISGNLWDQRSNPGLDETDYGVRVDAADGDGTTPATARSGVKSIDIYVDGTRVDYVSQQCPSGSCPMADDWLFETGSYGAGAHTIKVDVLDQLGHLTSTSWAVTVAARPFSCTGTPGYGVFWAGSSFEGLPMSGSARFCESYDPIMGRNEMVSYDYGDCQASTTQEGGCVAPLEVQSSPMCERHASLYTTGDPDASQPYPYESATIRGVPAAKFDGGTTIELYTGNTTVSVYGDDPAQVLRLANAIVASPDYLNPLTAPYVSPLINLGLPTSPDVLASTTECTS